MKTWSFTLRLNRAPTEAELDRLYEAGCDDAAFEGDLAHFDREAESMLDASWSAARAIRDAVPGLWAARAVLDDAVTIRDVAARTGRSYESVRLLIEGKRGPGGFPAPLVGTAVTRVFWWPDVAAWLRDAMGQNIEVPSRDLRVVDAMLGLDEMFRDARDDVEREKYLAMLRSVA